MPVKILVFYRFFFAALGFLPILLYKRTSFRLSKKNAGLMLVCSLIMGLYQYLFFKGLHVGLAGAGGVLVTTLSPLITFFCMALIKQKGLRLKEWVGLGLGVSSAVFFLQVWTLNMTHILDSGNGYFLAAALSWSLLTIVSQHTTMSSLLYNFYAFAIVSPLFIFGQSLHDIAMIFHQGSLFWLNMGFIVCCGTLFSTTMYFYITQKHGAKEASSYIFLVPTMALLFSFIFLHEKPSIWTVIGGGLALAGVYVLNQKNDEGVADVSV
jgi:drug/metabolite transporter (DMT)-like permease